MTLLSNKPTRGPWEARDDIGCGLADHIYSQDGALICTVAGSNEFTFPNARQMAASPDMRAALEMMLDEYHELGYFSFEAACKGRTALAKARGETAARNRGDRMTDKPTPGSWRASSERHHARQEYIVWGPNGGMVASVHEEADARQIAASPELHEVARRFVELFDAAGGEAAEAWEALYEQARRALEKARGCNSGKHGGGE